MKKLLLIFCLFVFVDCKAQQVNYALMEINKENIVRGDFKIEITPDKVYIGREVYHIHNQKENKYFLMKDGFLYEMTLLEDSLSVFSPNQDLLLVYYKD